MAGKAVIKALTAEELTEQVRNALEAEEKKITRVLADGDKPPALQTIETPAEMDAIVQKVVVSTTNSLSAVEWAGMEAAMPPDERTTHRNLSMWMAERAKERGVEADEPEEEDDDEGEEGEEGEDGEDDDDEDEEEEDEVIAKMKKLRMEPEKPVQQEEKNWSAVKMACEESKLSFRGYLSAPNFTNWLWYNVVREKLEETKGKLTDLEPGDVEGVEEVDAILGEFLPPKKKKDDKKDKKDDKKDKKDDKKDKKDKKDDKKDKKDDKKDKKKVDKKMEVKLTSAEKIQAANLIKNMVYGEQGKNKTIVQGWANIMMEKEVPVLLPWEFQLAHVLRGCLEMEYKTGKKKEAPNPLTFYESVQSLADAIARLRLQYKLVFPSTPEEQILPLQDALAVQKRIMEGSCGGIKFDLLWYLRHGAHLLAGSNFAKRHISTVFKPFLIQELMTDAVFSPGPQLIFGIAPPGTGKTAIVSHMLQLFPHHSLVFCCAALPVVLGVGRIANSLGIPYAFVKGRRITPSYACGHRLGTYVDNEGDGRSALQGLREKIIEENMLRKRKRLGIKKKTRSIHDVKRMPKLYLLCDTSSCAWILRQLNPNRSILVIDEPPMGSDQIPGKSEDNPLAASMVQAMMTPMYKTIWMSATLPRRDALPTLVSNFMERFSIPEDKKDQHVRECFSCQLDRGVVLCRPNGSVAFPHELCTTSAHLMNLSKRLPTDPLVLKAYTERALSGILARWESLKEKKVVSKDFKAKDPADVFSDLSHINHTTIRQYCLDILEAVANTNDDAFVTAFCSTEGTTDTLFPKYDLQEMIFGNASYFPGLTLMADEKPADLLLNMSERLMAQMPKVDDLQASIEQQEVQTKKQEKYLEDDEQVESSQPKLKFNPELVIQSQKFLDKWCPGHEERGARMAPRVLPNVSEFRAIQKLPVDDKWKMLALAGAASVDPKLDEDKNNPAYTTWVQDAMTMNKLVCVTAGKEFTWGANVPASTIVVTSSFADNTSVSGMLQYIGRAARRGLTTHGQALFENDRDLDRLFTQAQELQTEAETMERYAVWWKTKGKEWPESKIKPFNPPSRT
jgi:hypothetical protein